MIANGLSVQKATGSAAKDLEFSILHVTPMKTFKEIYRWRIKAYMYYCLIHFSFNQNKQHLSVSKFMHRQDNIGEEGYRKKIK